MNILYPALFCIFFVSVFLILQATRLEEFFKQGKIWQIRFTYLILSFVISYLLTSGLNYLIDFIGK